MTPLHFGERFAFLEPGWLLVCALLLIATAVWRHLPARSDWQRVIAAPVLAYLGHGTRRRRRIDLTLLGAALVALALSEPSWRSYSDDTWRHSVGWIAVADVSRSMTLNDIAPSRLAAMRATLRRLSQRAGARPIALILYAGDAFLVVPPAFDRSLFNEHIAHLEHGMIPLEGSNTARALSLATAVAEDSGMLKARIFLLGDTGGSNRQSIAAARYLGERGHQLDVLLFGQIDANGEQPVDLSAAEALASEAGGLAVRSNALGVIDLDRLSLTDASDSHASAELQSLIWASQSHWLLLPLLPLVLWLFRSNEVGA